jgi:hypothetical protein
MLSDKRGLLLPAGATDNLELFFLSFHLLKDVEERERGKSKCSGFLISEARQWGLGPGVLREIFGFSVKAGKGGW